MRPFSRCVNDVVCNVVRPTPTAAGVSRFLMTQQQDLIVFGQHAGHTRMHSPTVAGQSVPRLGAAAISGYPYNAEVVVATALGTRVCCWA